MEVYSKTSEQDVQLSIVVPIYNTEHYLEATLNSIISNPIKGLEIIAVNDGSKDNSLTVVTEWFKKHDIEGKIITTVNQGLSATRNTGLKTARGKYINFFDSDDICLSRTYQKALEVFERDDVDFVMTRSISFDTNTQEIFNFPDEYVWNVLLEKQPYRIVSLTQEPRVARLEASSVVRIFRRDFLIQNDLFFPVGLLFEDAVFHVKCICQARKIGLINSSLLMYRVNRDGQITSLSGQRRFDMIKILNEIQKELQKYDVNQEIISNLLGLLINMTLWCGENCDFKERRMFFSQALNVFNKFPKECLNIYQKRYSFSEWESKLALAFMRNDLDDLIRISEGRYPLQFIDNDIIDSQYTLIEKLKVFPKRIIKKLVLMMRPYINRTYRLLKDGE